MGCEKTITFTINPPTNPLQIDAKRKNIKCKDDKNGEAWVSILTGQAPFTFAWTSLVPLGAGCTIANPTNDTIFNLCPGQYIVTVTDGFLCEKKDTVTITEPDSLKLNVKSSINPKCFGEANGSISVGAIGGTKPYLFSWNASAFVLGDSIRLNLLGGPNTITVRDSNLCQFTRTVVLANPDSISVNLITERETCLR